jgi:hypothetical protein
LPALDRAKAKISALLESPTTRGTPTDSALDDELIQGKYNLADETRLQLSFGNTDDIGNGYGKVQYAWRFPVDTNNNGRFDSLSLYSILFRTPAPNNGGEGERTPLQARTQPMQQGGQAASSCGAGTSASLTGSQGWYKVGSKLARTFFVYVATVPITDLNPNIVPPGEGNKYEPYRGNKSFSALEFQQDKAQQAVSNNAIYYDDDLEISPGPGITVNGRIMTNSNLFVNANAPIELKQVSSKDSCFYEAVNGKIVVGGNLRYGSPVNGTNTGGTVQVDLFEEPDQDPNTDPRLTGSDNSVNTTPDKIAYNSQAYEARIAKLVQKAIENGITKDNAPEEVQEGINAELQRLTPTGSTEAVITEEQALQDQLETYFRKRVRRVPFAEVELTIPYNAENNDPLYPSIDTTGTGDDLQPSPDSLIYPFNPSDGTTASGYAEVTLNTEGDKLKPQATKFSVQENDAEGTEEFLGDRVQVGNNLPQSWPNPSGGPSDINQEQSINGTTWDDTASANETRARKTRVNLLGDVADTRRNGFWELNAQKTPNLASDGFGGLRVVTGAGIYLPPRTIPATTMNASTVVWPDTMPVIPSPAVVRVGQQSTQPAPQWLPPSQASNGAPDFPVDAQSLYRPYLQMRATAVYHYTYAQGKRPIACVSSYYDPTDQNSARNALLPVTLPEVSGDPTLPVRGKTPAEIDTYRSNNGVTYPAPTITENDVRGFLNYQAQLVYPNGRPVNQQLKNALDVGIGRSARSQRTLAEQAAVDSALCALQILGTRGVPTLTPTETPTAGYTLPYGTIKEIAFLDARQIKAIDGVTFSDESTGLTYTDYTLTGRYDLSIEQRQPLEVRATVLDLDKLRRASTRPAPYGAPEHMLPNSGIIYATRDDALPDASSIDTANGETYSDAQDDASSLTGKKILKLSSNDFLLDPTRRANGIMLTNGLKLWRNPDYRVEEKGLILASNLPVYVQAQPVGVGSIVGGFNLHRYGDDSGLVEEFAEQIAAGSDFYGRTDLDENFACRRGDERLPDCTMGDQWRSATIIADSVTLLSKGNNRGFREGYRSDGDYDLRNNEIDNIADPDVNTAGNELLSTTSTRDENDAPSIEWNRLTQGFWNNNFVTSHQFTDAEYAISTPPTTKINSSYFNNGVTPVQRRGMFSEYLMEMCDKREVSQCTAGDWYIGTYIPANGPQAGLEIKVKASSSIDRVFATDDPMFTAGTTAQFPGESDPNPDVAKRPRRVAFARNRNNGLILDREERPIPLGIKIDGTVDCFGPTNQLITVPKLVSTPGKGQAGYVRRVDCEAGNSPDTLPRLAENNNALWFATTTDPSNLTALPNNYGYNYPLAHLNGTNPSLPQITKDNAATLQYQPLLVPVLQLQALTLQPGPDVPSLNETRQTRATNWLPRAAGNTTFNLIMAVGDNPSHPQSGAVGGEFHAGDFNGGVQNLPHFIENWIIPPGTADNPPSYDTNISGSFIQLKRSYYATAPNTQLPRVAANSQPGGIFSNPQKYPTGNTQGRAPYYEVPKRKWGFDVGLLSQTPDLFSNQFVLPSTGRPNEFFREVDRSDKWVQTLLCAKVADGPGAPAINQDQRPTQFCANNQGA